MDASAEMQEYFEGIRKRVVEAHSIASAARAKGYDPDTKVEIRLASNLAERVVGLISIVAPQIADSKIVGRIIELENKYGALDWRVAISICIEVAQQKFCAFKDKKEAMEVGIRVGLAYLTLGTVSAPLDGFVGIEFKKRMDGNGEYVSVSFAGPIRGAGGTAAAVVLLLADTVRKVFGFAEYDAQEGEICRTYAEITDYRERSAPRQYFPAFEEIEFLMRHMPVEVSGEASEEYEVSNYKDQPRIGTNNVRGGFCLIMTECLPLKAPKLWRQINAWGRDFGLDNWNFLEEYLKLQKKVKARSSTGQESASAAKILPDYSYIYDLVAGRPIFSHPLGNGGFRLRYGRSRNSGYSACAVHPATMAVSSDYIATGTQFKHERPSKGAAVTACDSVEGPIVRLANNSVVQLHTLQQAKAVLSEVVEILYLGDLLVPYGDFFNRAHPLVPAGYCPEWWAQELEKALPAGPAGPDFAAAEACTGVKSERIRDFVSQPLDTMPSASEAIAIARLGVPLHPAYTYFWASITQQQLQALLDCFAKSKQHFSERGLEKIVLPKDAAAKRALELIGIPHSVAADGAAIVAADHATAFAATIGNLGKVPEDKPVLQVLNEHAGFVLRDRAGTFIGARMGRPEKAKMRKLTGTPHCLFPVGEEGGKFRSFQAAVAKGTITAEFPRYACQNCNRSTVLSVCENCDRLAQRLRHCQGCNSWIAGESCPRHGTAGLCAGQKIDARHYFAKALEKLGMRSYPELIKGVRGTSNREHIPEHIAKGILRARHRVAVNKEGTVRYDMTQLPVTHFKPAEIGTPVERLRQLGYEKDVSGMRLENDGQVLELKPQDIILPDCDASPDEGSAAVLLRVAAFIDDLLVSLYGLKPFYNVAAKSDLVGHLFVCLAPHTSAGVAGRLIGFSKTQGFFAHPYMHAATRRDCDGDEACVMLLLDSFLNFSRKYLPDTRGATMDAPLVLTSRIIPSEVDDMVLDLDVVWKYPLELYEAALQYRMPWEIRLQQVKALLGKPAQYEGFGFTHGVSDLNATVRCSAYKTLPSMEDKLKGQMELAEKIRAVDASDVARLVIEKHFIRDTKGNLRKFGMQEFRCVNCNEKFHRPPLVGKCTACGGRILFTVSEGSVIKYLEPTISLARKYNVSKYLQQAIELLQLRIEGVFGREKDKQVGLGAWFG